MWHFLYDFPNHTPPSCWVLRSLRASSFLRISPAPKQAVIDKIMERSHVLSSASATNCWYVTGSRSSIVTVRQLCVPRGQQAKCWFLYTNLGGQIPQAFNCRLQGTEMLYWGCWRQSPPLFGRGPGPPCLLHPGHRRLTKAKCLLCWLTVVLQPG